MPVGFPTTRYQGQIPSMGSVGGGFGGFDLSALYGTANPASLGQSMYGLGSGTDYSGLSTLGGAAGAAFGPAGMAIGSALGGLAGGMLSKKKLKRQRKKLTRQIEAERNVARNVFGRGIGQQEALSRQATQQSLGGFDLAKKAAQMSAQGAKRTALERGQQSQASLAQGLVNRGLGSTSVGANLSRGLGADTSRELSDIDSALGQYFGNLAMGRSGLEAAGTRELADLAGQRSQFDISDAQFWTPQLLSQLGSVQSRL